MDEQLVFTSPGVVEFLGNITYALDATRFGLLYFPEDGSPAPLGSHASLMIAGDDGSDVYFVRTANQAGRYGRWRKRIAG